MEGIGDLTLYPKLLLALMYATCHQISELDSRKSVAIPATVWIVVMHPPFYAPALLLPLSESKSDDI